MAMSRERITMIEIVQSLYRLANFYQLVKFVVKFKNITGVIFNPIYHFTIYHSIKRIEKYLKVGNGFI